TRGCGTAGPTPAAPAAASATATARDSRRAGHRATAPQHLRAVAVAVEIVLVAAAVAVVQTAALERRRLLLSLGDRLALGRHRALAAEAERSPVGGAG